MGYDTYIPYRSGQLKNLVSISLPAFLLMHTLQDRGDVSSYRGFLVATRETKAQFQAPGFGLTLVLVLILVQPQPQLLWNLGNESTDVRFLYFSFKWSENKHKKGSRGSTWEPAPK